MRLTCSTRLALKTTGPLVDRKARQSGVGWSYCLAFGQAMPSMVHRNIDLNRNWLLALKTTAAEGPINARAVQASGPVMGRPGIFKLRGLSKSTSSEYGLVQKIVLEISFVQKMMLVSFENLSFMYTIILS